MTGSLLNRVLSTLELLSSKVEGAPLHEIAERLDLPKSAAHRLLAELVEQGYASQNGTGLYSPTARVLGLGHAWLAGHGITERVQPTLERLAAVTGDLARYAVVDGDRLAWVASAQGARFGLKVDPDENMEVVLYCTSAGQAWLASYSDEEAIRLVMLQGFGRLSDHSPSAPRTIDAFRERLGVTRERGYGWDLDSSAAGVASIAVMVRDPVSAQAIGVLSVSGPSARLAEPRLHELAPLLQKAAPVIGVAGARSPVCVREIARSATKRQARLDGARGELS